MMKQIPLPLPHQASMSVDDFLVTASNEDAVRWMNEWPRWPAHGLILTGPAGSGKTHLLNLWIERSDGRYVSVQGFSTLDIIELTKAFPCLAIDDGDHLAGDPATEEKLFHLLNHLKSMNGSLLVTMKQGAGLSGFKLPDLRSRLLALPATALGPLDDQLLSALIIKQFRDRQIALSLITQLFLKERKSRSRWLAAFWSNPMSDASTVQVALALGSNLGNRLQSLRAAIKTLDPYVTITEVSDVYETPAAYIADQPPFFNAVVLGTTKLEPLPLLWLLKAKESEIGRQPSFRYGPRKIDIDIIFYDNYVLQTKELTIPHHAMNERDFVLFPLKDVAPTWVHPVVQKTVEELVKSLPKTTIARVGKL
jgi:2-amino-4-hydroxy-6-hydroxymethyldihydropteridine diphosphokinase